MTNTPQLSTESAESTRMAFISNALAIVGFIILFVIIVWGLFHIVNLSGSSIGSFFSTSPSVTVTAPRLAVSGEPVSVSWKYNGKEIGSYSFLYECEGGFAFATGVRGSLATIPCGNAIDVGSSTSATIVPMLSPTVGTRTITVPVMIVYATESGARIQGSATIAMSFSTSSTPVASLPATTVQHPVRTAANAYSPASGATPRAIEAMDLVAHAASGPADLSVRMILVGVIDPSSGALLPQMPTSPAQTVGVEFDIANIGGTATGLWDFTAQLPTGPEGYLYTSPAQVSLKPGEHIVNVLRFAPNMRPGLITITADPENRVYDTNRANNIETAQI